MGLERIAAVMQHKHNNYEIDLFQTLLSAVQQVTGATDSDGPSLRVVADHIRSCAFLVGDGVLPSNEGRGYLLRRILRRACRHGHKLGARDAFFHRLVAPLVEVMGEAYPELAERQAQIEKILLLEEEQFARTLDQGLRILEQELAGLADREIPGELVFKLYDTFGFPVDLTADIARERGLILDKAGFESAMEAQRKRARGASRFAVDLTVEGGSGLETVFTGYQNLDGQGKVLALVGATDQVGELNAGEHGSVILDQTPFYAESGGQVGDRGVLEADGLRFEVRDTQKAGKAFVHHGQLVQGRMSTGDTVSARVDLGLRRATALNHSATHLLHAALRRVLGEHVAQKGSLVDAERTRFDFSHFEAVSAEQLIEIEHQVNEQVRNNSPVQVEQTDMKTAKQRGAMALFGEKYGDEVRLLTMGDGYSVELCGGTHVSRTGDIGLMRIVAESGIAAGVRRIEAVTGATAMARFETAEKQLAGIAQLLKAGTDDAQEKLEQVLGNARQLEKEVERLKARLASGVGNDLSQQAVDVSGIKVLAAALDGADVKTLRTTMDRMKDKLRSAVILLAASEGDNKISLVAGVTNDLTDRVKAGDLISETARKLGGKGGGRADMAQGGGSDVAALPKALDEVKDWVANRLA